MWIGDIVLLVACHPGLNWGKAVEIAASSGSERLLFLGLRLANDLLGAASPEPVMTRVRTDPHVTRLATTVVERLFESPPNGVEADRQKSLLQIMSRNRLWHKLWLAATPNESDWEVMRLPRSLWPLYYVIRPFRLIGKYGRRVASAP